MDCRHELKFLITDVQLEQLNARIEHLCRPDKNQKDADGYTITSLYFDTPYDRLLQESLDGVDRRHKYRLRCYDRDPSLVKLERKSKFHGMTAKLAVTATQKEWLLLRQGDCPRLQPDHVQEKQELLCQMQMYGLLPKTIVEYHRKAFVYPLGNVRITFDRNICASRDVNAFGSSTYHTVPLLGAGVHILEVKYDNLLPGFIRDALQTECLQRTSYSKYVQSRLKLG